MKRTEREGFPAAATPMMAERAKRETFILFELFGKEATLEIDVQNIL